MQAVHKKFLRLTLRLFWLFTAITQTLRNIAVFVYNFLRSCKFDQL